MFLRFTYFWLGLYAWSIWTTHLTLSIEFGQNRLKRSDFLRFWIFWIFSLYFVTRAILDLPSANFVR